MGIWGKRGIKGGGKGGVRAALWSGKGGVNAALWSGKGGVRATLRQDEQTVDGGMAAAVARDDGELASGHQRREDSLDWAAAQADFPFQRGPVDVPLAVLVGVVGDDDEQEEIRAFLARAGENGGDMLMTQGGHPAW